LHKTFYLCNIKRIEKKNVMDIFEPELDEEVQVLEDEDTEKSLIILNDDFNTFHHVIISLIQIVGLTLEKATEVTMAVHNEGACIAKNGTLKELKPMKEALNERGIDAVVEDSE
jgi:ATP-dependent Clp protease adaptor protein ClpS